MKKITLTITLDLIKKNSIGFSNKKVYVFKLSNNLSHLEKQLLIFTTDIFKMLIDYCVLFICFKLNSNI